MKNIFFAFMLLTCKSFAQTDSSSLPISVKLPVKAVLIYANYVDLSTDRKSPDYLITLIGSGVQLDSVLNVTLPAGKLFNLITKLQNEPYSAVNGVVVSILNNNPSIVGYTGLVSQINTIANGNGAQKNAGLYLRNAYTAYLAERAFYQLQLLANGLNKIQN